ncbi:hypothetical protein ACVWW6_004827 [Bradyrhizobium sp. USDA 3311]
MAIQHRHVRAPFLRLGVVVEGGIGAALADQRLMVHAEDPCAVGYVGEPMIRPGLPEPVGRGLGIVAEALLARARVAFGALADFQVALEIRIGLTQLAIGPLEIGAHGVEGVDHLVQFVRIVGRPALQVQRRRRPHQAVLADEVGDGNKVPRHQEMEHVDDEQRDEERLRRLACQDDQGTVQQLLIDLAQRRLDMEHADRARGALHGVVQRVIARDDRTGVRLADRDTDRIGAISDLAHLGGADVGQPQDAVELELELVLVEIPQAFAEAAGGAPADLVEPRLDDADLAVIVEIELKRGQHQRDD